MKIVSGGFLVVFASCYAFLSITVFSWLITVLFPKDAGSRGLFEKYQTMCFKSLRFLWTTVFGNMFPLFTKLGSFVYTFSVSEPMAGPRACLASLSRLCLSCGRSPLNMFFSTKNMMIMWLTYFAGVSLGGSGKVVVVVVV